jgi:hypothetical protein
MSERLETILWLKKNLWLRPRTGALRGGLSQPATTGNFRIRITFELSLLPSPTSLSTQAKKLRRMGF